MTSVAATSVPLGNTTIPVEWITSGAIAPVGASPVVSAPVASPAAAVPTGWSAQPVVVADPSMSGAALLDALAALQVSPPPAAEAASTSSAPMVPEAATTTTLPATVPTLGVAPVPASVGTLPSDPTTVSSVAGAIKGYASATGTKVRQAVGAGAATARRVGSELWAGVRNPRAVHVTQVPSKYNAAPAAGNRDCGPASVVMTLELLGKRIPGIAANAAPQKLINRVRQLAGNASNTRSTTNHELEQALQAAGTTTREVSDAASIKAAVLAGRPVILNGNPRNPGAYGPSFSAKQMTPYDGAHWIVVSGYDTKSGKFIINDPLSKAGAVKVTPAQLEAYRGGSLGIEVTA
jgi:hypothetical protein